MTLIQQCPQSRSTIHLVVQSITTEHAFVGRVCDSQRMSCYVKGVRLHVYYQEGSWTQFRKISSHCVAKWNHCLHVLDSPSLIRMLWTISSKKSAKKSQKYSVTESHFYQKYNSHMIDCACEAFYTTQVRL